MEQETIHPFVGLRPFEEEEEHLFFGREKSITELMSRLRTSRFLAVIGTSGSGKSSLVKSGLLPALYRGGMSGAGSHWRVAVFRPGDDPVGNLADALAQTGIWGGAADWDYTDEDADNAAIYGKFIETTLRRSSKGLVELLKQSGIKTHENLLLVVDQFEELFRFSRLERNKRDGKRDSVAFIKLLLESCKHMEVSLYVLLTMRSDFLGDCTEFQGLPEAINDGQYLIPRMTREEKRAAVVGPISVGGGEISPTLLSRLLNDVGDNPDHLPILQHALMRTWDYWREHRADGEPMGLKHYEAIGTMERALSNHAEEAYKQLKSERLQEICRKMFKLITDLGETGRGVRRPAKVGEICRATNASRKEVIDVIDIFRQPGRTFLMPPHGVELDADSVIDISHESFMRIWTRLIRWVDEEAQSAELYIRLAKAAALYEQRRAALWRDPELMLALKWQKEYQPNAEWAQRYDPSFQRAVAFLEASKKQKDLEIAEKERAQRNKIRRNRIVTVIIALTALVSVYFAILASIEKNQADVAREKAEQKSIEANQARETALKAQKKEEIERLKAEQKEEEARKAKELAEAKEIQAREAEAKALQNEQAAKRAESRAKKNERRARENHIKGQIQGLIVQMNREEARFRQFLAKAKELAVQSINVAGAGDNQLKTLLALTAYRLGLYAVQELMDSARRVFGKFDKRTLQEFSRNKDLQQVHIDLQTKRDEMIQVARNRRQPPEIFDALRKAYVALQGNREDGIANSESWALAATANDRIIFNTPGGELLATPLKPTTLTLPVIDEKQQIPLTAESNIQRSGISRVIQVNCFTRSDDALFCGTYEGYIFRWETESWKGKQLPGSPGGKILSMVYSYNKKRLYYSVDNLVYMHDLKGNTELVVHYPDNPPGNLIRTLTIVEEPGSGQSIIIAADSTGQVFWHDINADIRERNKLNSSYIAGAQYPRFHASAYSPKHRLLVMGNAGGELHLFSDVDAGTLKRNGKISHQRIDKGHHGCVKALVFSSDGRYLASAGLDGIAMMWDLQGKDVTSIARGEPLLTIFGKNKILSAAFDLKGEFLVLGDEHRLRICPTRPEIYYKVLCRKKRREFSREEWSYYIGTSLKPGDLSVCPTEK